MAYFVGYPTIISVIYQNEKVKYFSNKNAITLMRAKKGQKVDWAQIIFNSLCSELDRWYKYVKEKQGDKKGTFSVYIGISKNLSISICASKGESTKTTNQSFKN